MKKRALPVNANRVEQLERRLRVIEQTLINYDARLARLERGS